MGWRVTAIAAGIMFSGWIGIAAEAALPVDDHAFSIIRGRVPRILAAGAEVRVKLELGNEGRRVWRADGSFAVSYHWLDQDGTIVDWEGRRTRFPRQVGPGDTVEIDALLVAPQHPGSYRLQWDIVEEGVCWFSQRASVPPPADAVRVVSDPISDPRWWALFSLLAAAVAVAATAGGSRRWAVLFAVGDVLWCFGALTVKQSIVLTAAGFPATAGGWLMICGGAAACLLAVEALPERFRGWARWGLAAGATCVLWVDAVHLRFFGDLPSPAELLSVGQLGRVEASIRSLLEPGDIWFWLDLIAGVVLVLTAARLRRLVHPRRRVVIVALGVIVLAGAVAGVRFAVTQPGLYRQVFRRVMVAREVGVLNLQAVELGGSLKHRLLASELSPEALAETTRWFVERAPLRAGVGEFFGAAEGANLVMVQVESLQGFVIGLEIEGREVTPFLNRWRQEALWFSNVTDQTGSGRSADSELATQVSLLPPSGGAAAFRFAGNDFIGLAEVLAEHDYHTVSAVPYDGSFWNRRRMHPAYGFQRSRFVDDFGTGESIGWGLNDRDFLAQMADRLATAERPFAAYLLTLSLHHPFAGFPEHLKELEIGHWEGTPFGNFLHTMKFFDRALAGFVADLERDGLAGSTVIAIWGDHDAGFDWRSEIAEVMGATFDPAGWYLSQEVLLVIKVPGAPELKGERPVAAGHVDVAPTLLALLGVDPAPYAFVGRNLLGEPGDTPVVGEYGCWRDARHLFLQGDGTLADGRCLDVATLVNAPPSECAEAFAEALRTAEISSLVLEHDLQQRISDELAKAQQ
jgi:phosphoglycerol transferase MdoB-like AlkP superfamily enzyme